LKKIAPQGRDSPLSSLRRYSLERKAAIADATAAPLPSVKGAKIAPVLSVGLPAF